jgi:hypothetical protein
LLLPGGSIDPRYNFLFLFSENPKITNNSTTTEPREKNGTVLECLEFEGF